MLKPITTRLIPAAQTHDLRLRVLRPGQSPERADYPEDRDPSSFHLGAFDANGVLLGVASFYREPLPGAIGESPTNWRLRGMAVEPAAHGQGIGSALLRAGLTRLRDNGGRLLWCNARATAMPFYTRMEFTVIGAPFDMPDIGLHYLMARSVI